MEVENNMKIERVKFSKLKEGDVFSMDFFSDLVFCKIAEKKLEDGTKVNALCLNSGVLFDISKVENVVEVKAKLVISL